MTSNHTQYGQFRAPFHVEMNDEPDNQNKGTIHIIDNHGDLIGTAIDEKIARTFAAAPELYDIALAARKHLCDEKPRADELHAILKQMDAAIAKAEGRDA